MRKAAFASGVFLVACGSCNKASLGPLEETPPAALPASGVLIDFPSEGAKVTGRWVAVTGWFDPAKVDFVAVTGAPLPEFYNPAGHVGLPTVPVKSRANGRFIAPRVPVVEGANSLWVIPFKDGQADEPIALAVEASDVDRVPATVVADPAFPAPGQSVTLRASNGVEAAEWQWDLDGDGTFDVQSSAPARTYDTAGQYLAVARTKAGEGWVYGVVPLTVAAASEQEAETAAVTAPSMLRLVRGGGGTAWVLALDGDAVKVFDPSLAPVRTLGGLKDPGGVDGTPDGYVTVADTGNDRLVRFDPAGAVDDVFSGDAGTFTIQAPRSVLMAVKHSPLQRASLVFVNGDGTVYECHTPADGAALPWSCSGGEWERASALKPKLIDVSELESPVEGPIGVTLQAEDGRWLRSDLAVAFVPLPAAAGVERWVPGGDATETYDLGLGGDAVLRERYGPREVRRTTLPFAVTAAAVDVSSRSERDPSFNFGPVHVYVAGQGVLQRRKLGGLNRGLR